MAPFPRIPAKDASSSQAGTSGAAHVLRAAPSLYLASSQSAEAVLLHDWQRAVAASWAWAILPTIDSYFLARTAWQRVEGDWLRLWVGRR
jgi:hypothetical protein